MPDEWQPLLLSHLYNFSSGLSKPRSEFGFGNGFLTFKDVLDNYFVPDELSALVNSTEKEQANCSIKRGDVFLTRTSETQPDLGMSCVALKDYPKATFNGFTKRLRPKSQDLIVPEYAAYYFRGPRFRQAVTSMSSLSTRASLNNEMLSRLSIVLPPVSEQRAIGFILKSLDDKIELNRRMNRTLKELARALFQSWFVDFTPVRDKAAGQSPTGVPPYVADLFPDSLADSPFGLIPTSWQVRTIKETASRIQYGLTTSATQEPLGPRFLRITDIRGGAIDWTRVPYCKASADDNDKYRVIDGDIVVARTGASTGENAYIVEPPEAVFASYLVRFQFAERGYARIVGEFMRSERYFDFVKSSLGGSAQPNANAQTLAGASLVLPPVLLADRFYELLRPLDLKRAMHDKEASTLAALRDALLPKLISGQLRVLDAERVIQRVV